MNRAYLEARHRYIKNRTKPDYWSFRPWVGAIICLGAIILDFCVMTAFFTDMRDLNIIMSAMGVIVVIDVIPMALIPLYKNWYVKLEKAPKWLFVLSVTVIIVMMAAVAGVKLYAMDSLNETRSMPITIPKIFLETVIPLATSTLTALVTWCTYHPLKRARERIELRIAECEFDLTEIQSRKAKYDVCTKEYRAELEMQAARKYLAACGKIEAIAADLKSYFVCRLSERLASPVPVNVLSANPVGIKVPRLKLPVMLSNIYEPGTNDTEKFANNEKEEVKNEKAA